MKHLLEKNRAWAAARTARDPGFFTRLSAQQAPRYLWIGCSDSRVPATEIVDLDPGEIFVHRNVANLAVHTDLNFLSVLQFAVEVLEVEHILVVGHYGCGGIRAAMSNRSVGLVDNWLRNVRDIRERYKHQIEAAGDEHVQEDLMVEINVLTQLGNVARNPIVQRAWRQGRPLRVHGWVYRLQDGILHDLGYQASSVDDLDEVHHILERV
ncbi:MAG: carbonic anhydrase [Geminicoccaceae bacterium]|nr:carbonic anhydrase [Geminicoccaceae bacterium]